jgi:hypothetical protein
MFKVLRSHGHKRIFIVSGSENTLFCTGDGESGNGRSKCTGRYSDLLGKYILEPVEKWRCAEPNKMCEHFHDLTEFNSGTVFSRFNCAQTNAENYIILFSAVIKETICICFAK